MFTPVLVNNFPSIHEECRNTSAGLHRYYPISQSETPHTVTSLAVVNVSFSLRYGDIDTGTAMIMTTADANAQNTTPTFPVHNWFQVQGIVSGVVRAASVMPPLSSLRLN